MTSWMRFEQIVRANPDLMRLRECLRSLSLPELRLVSGCLYQTVWNVLTRRPRGAGLQDYEVIYFDGGDLSWDAEDSVIRQVAASTTDFSAPVQVRNQARVHLRYEAHFGAPYTALQSADESPRQSTIITESPAGDTPALAAMVREGGASMSCGTSLDKGMDGPPSRTRTECSGDAPNGAVIIVRRLTRSPATMQAIGVRLEDDDRLDILAPFGLDDIFHTIARANPLGHSRGGFDAKAARARAVWPEVTLAPEAIR